MRGVVPGLPSPHPIGLALPAMYLEDEFVQRFTAGLDEVLAPVLLTLDCLDAVLDPELAPPDFVDWLAGWVGVPVDPAAPVALRRDLLRHAVELHRWRGTARGIAAAVRLLTDGEVRVTDSGWVRTPASPEPAGNGPPEVLVEVRPADPDQVDRHRLDELVRSLVPAHVRVTVEVTGT
ncbi:MAG TPA: phage tail protein [Micromonospora sp.]